MKALITTIPFGKYDKTSLQALEDNHIEYLINPFDRKIKEDELKDMINDYDFLIAGTEPITSKVLNNAGRLKLISRVGIGINNIDIDEAKRRDIKITYTPNGPDDAVADLTVGFIFSLLRSVQTSNNLLRKGIWKRKMGLNINEATIGIIGVGRIGLKVARVLQKLSPKLIMLNDEIIHEEIKGQNIIWASLDRILQEADIITLHTPLTEATKGMISKNELVKMKPESSIINTSRGGVLIENDLYEVMLDGHLSGAAIDVYENEPYSGPLTEIDRCLLTAHTGTMTRGSRSMMEKQAVQEVVNFVKNKELDFPI